VVVLPLRRAPAAPPPDLIGQALVAGGDGTAVTERAQVFAFSDTFLRIH
jgi:hypothetical protein